MQHTASGDFAFNHGEWIVAHHRLAKRGSGSSDWSDFETRTDAQLLMGGTVSIDETDFPATGSKGMTFRVYDPVRDRWAIYWISSADGVLQPPVFGRFNGSVGIFEGDDTDAGRPVRVRFEWNVANPQTPRWSQSFSYDAGASWELNWVMDFRRP